MGALFALLVIAAWLRTPAWWIAACIAGGVFLIGMAVVATVLFRRTGNAWRKFPDTPEYREYAAKREKQDKR